MNSAQQTIERPEVILGQPYILSALRGNPLEGPTIKGTVLAIRGQYWKALGTPKVKGISIYYDLAPATKEEYDTRAGRVRVPGNHVESEYDYAGHQIGRCVEVQVQGLWLQVKKIEFVRTSGGSISSLTPYGLGNFVTPEKAQKLNEKWNAKEAIRRAELKAKCPKW